MIRLFSDLPAYEFTEQEINRVFGDRVISGTCLLQTTRDGGSAVTSSSDDMKLDLLQICRGEKSLPVAQAPHRFWKYMSKEEIEGKMLR